MKTVNSLEKSIHALIETGRKFREERDNTFIEAEQVRSELHEAKEKIKELRSVIKKIEKNDTGFQNREDRKKEIINTLKNILSKLNTVSIDNITSD
ncbi:MAG: hypothetical protein HOC71_05615 [Candidatus Latescibacteria bacterium]|jgi:uncharacterized coiled-coil DUF342 family protein|nr:hypothetical protein [Candidatus Latescibacterota bacterium]